MNPPPPPEPNYYQPSPAALAGEVEDYAAMRSPLFIQGRALVMPKLSVLPNVCVKSGVWVDGEPPRRMVLAWHSPWVYIAIPVNLLLYVILAIALRKRGEVVFWLAPEIWAERKKWLLWNWLAFLGGIGSLVAAVLRRSEGFGWAGLALIIASIFIYYRKVRLIWAQRITDTALWLRGIPPAVQQMMVEHSRGGW